jgi:hypothetical protein
MITEAVLGVTAIDSRMGAVPVPVSVTSWGLESPVSTTVSVPFRVPWTLGVKVTEIVQLAPALRVAGLTGQLLVSPKSDRFVLILLIVIAELCPFVSVTLWIELVVPCAWLPNEIEVGLTVTDCEIAGNTNAMKQASSEARRIARKITEKTRLF